MLNLVPAKIKSYWLSRHCFSLTSKHNQNRLLDWIFPLFELGRIFFCYLLRYKKLLKEKALNQPKPCFSGAGAAKWQLQPEEASMFWKESWWQEKAGLFRWRGSRTSGLRWKSLNSNRRRLKYFESTATTKKGEKVSGILVLLAEPIDYWIRKLMLEL